MFFLDEIDEKSELDSGEETDEKNRVANAVLLF